ncbi:protein involved in mitochondrial homologous DNA recombination [Scheffersomyces stipitis CBS 6054]|uniref:Large ribosomal subunit protein mL67 n=1 Tax=Scheffersomyces stipitis (strain ATCC 58785 / CBS 6054 / NBRC 10063 / NRRL Y-11545) TaxID=322104 RepID=A3GFY6_PICST|nr:protein involved in mitochondrial homologous DNA recombination [Scheffersomyces stipitis CBS 6054]EAZ63425.2 protein involved in mitochondrial homologous DNA recombination [Scheffersomyces stipitis CBS 6054]KAG2735119.1 hypothetical protein G9P44_001333 [Scheffersomyces stipitis]
MPMRLRAEKKMRKHLIEQLKARKVLGARIAQGKNQSVEELQHEKNLGPQVFLFKNMFSGQVLYSQVPAFHQDQIDQQFVRPNWENRKPSRRSDLWRIMCVASFKDYEHARAAFRGLVQLRQARDVVQQKEAKALRKKNDDGNTWYAGQYRPTYSQEAVADLAHVIEEFNLEGTKLLWENAWRRGEDKHWRLDLVEHDTLPPFNPRDQSILLDEVSKLAVEEFAKLRQAEAVEAQTGVTESA